MSLTPSLSPTAAGGLGVLDVDNKSVWMTRGIVNDWLEQRPNISLLSLVLGEQAYVTERMSNLSLAILGKLVRLIWLEHYAGAKPRELLI